MIAEEELPAVPDEELRRLLRETQQLAAAKAISEDQIAEEIADYRAGIEHKYQGQKTPKEEKTHMNISEYVVADPKVMLGKPVIRGTRITVELILEKLANGESIEQIIEAHPRLSREAVSAALTFATESGKTIGA